MEGETLRHAFDRSTLLILLPVLIALALLYGRPIIDGDGVSYYALTRSLIRDHDWRLANEHAELGRNVRIVWNQAGRAASFYSGGFALLYAPFLLPGEMLSTATQPYLQNIRIPFSHSFGIFLGSCLFGFLTIRIASSLTQNSRWIPLALFVGTPLMFYTFTMPSYTHAADTFLISFAFLLAVSSGNALRNVLLGVTLSLSVFLRVNNAVLAVPIVMIAIYLQRNGRALIPIISGALPVLLVQLYFNYDQYGRFLASPYRVSAQSFLIPMLFHPFAGMFIWSPIVLLALIGLGLGAWKKERIAVASLILVCVALLSIQFQANWWGGCSFGQRFFTHLYVFWVIGIWRLFHAIKSVRIPAALCCFWTFFLFNCYYMNYASWDGRKMLNQDNCRHTPWQMIHQANADLSRSGRNPLAFWYSMLGRGPYPTIASLLLKKSCDSILPPLMFWLQEVGESPLQLSDPDRTGVVVPAGTLELAGEKVEALPGAAMQIPESTPALALVRIEIRSADFSEQQRNDTLHAILEILKRPGLAGVQLDFRPASPDREFFQHLLRDLREKLPDTMLLSVLVSPSWCNSFPRLKNPSVDEFVPVLFGVGRRHIVEGEFTNPLCRCSAGISLSSPVPSFLHDRRIYVHNPAPWTPDSVRSALQFSLK